MPKPVTLSTKQLTGHSINNESIASNSLAGDSLIGEIPGVFAARQQRSVRIRDSFINVGVETLNQVRLKDLTVAALCHKSGNSVGAFYARFQDKDAYFRALRGFTIESQDHQAMTRFNSETLKGNDARQTLETLVDLMVDIFTSRYRGVLRESLVLILEPDDPWAPMRSSALKIVSTLQENLADCFPQHTAAETNTRCRFCFQLIVGALQNDLVNDYHVFTTRDDSLRKGLKEAVWAYMGLTN